MQFKLKVTPIKSTDEKDNFLIDFSTYKSNIQGRFEKSEIREIIEILDNAIHH